jgi:HD-GYP domain-containing protein (c-di-GMP phosphodiesterase class II)
MGIPEAEIDDLRMAARSVHDIGMLTLPDSLCASRAGCRRPNGSCCAASADAYGMLIQLSLPELVLQSVVHQHERWDASGYRAD